MGSAESTSKTPINDSHNLRDSLVSILNRRIKRKISNTEDNVDRQQIYNQMNKTPDLFPSHLQTCLTIHQTKPWLKKKIRHTLIAYPEKGKTPPTDIKRFFSNIPYKSAIKKENDDIEANGKGYIWYIPSLFLWKAHCFVQHQKDSHISCSVNKLVRTFTDSHGESNAFVFSVVYNDGTFEILNEEHYKKECLFWADQTSVTGNFNTRKMILKTKSIYSKEGNMARSLMKEQLATIFTKLQPENIMTSKNSLIVNIENEFLNNILLQGKNTIYDYVENCLRIFIFVKPDSPLAKYTLNFRNRLLRKYYNLSSIPTLTTEDMFPEYHANSGNKGIDEVKNWITAYLIQEIDDFFDRLVTYLDRTLNRPNKIISDIGEIPINDMKKIEDICPDVDPDEVIVYRDEDDKIFCFTIDQLLDREDDMNPLNPSKKIEAEFLYRFDREFKGKKIRTKKEMKEDEMKEEEMKEEEMKEDDSDKVCTQCSKHINEYILRTGNLSKDGDEFKSHIDEFCSVECLEKYKKIEELFGPSTPDNSEELKKKEEKINEINDKNKKELYEIQTEKNNLLDRIQLLENMKRTLETQINNHEEAEDKLKNTLNKKEELLEEKEEKLKNIINELKSRSGLNDNNSIDDMFETLDTKTKKEKNKLEEEIKKEKKDISVLTQELKEKTNTIGDYETKKKGYETTLKTYEITLEDLKKQYHDVVRIKEKEREILQKQISAINKEKEKLDEQNKNLENMNKQSIDDLKEKEKKLIEVFNEKIEAGNNLFKNERAEKDVLINRIKELEKFNETQEENKLIYTTDKERLKLQIKNLEEQVKQTNELEAEIKALKEIKDTSPSVNKTIKDLEAELAKLRLNTTTEESLQSKINDLEADLTNVNLKLRICPPQDEQERIGNEIKELRDLASTKDKLLKELEDDIKTLSENKKDCDSSLLEKQLEDAKIAHQEELKKKELNFDKNIEELKNSYEKQLEIERNSKVAVQSINCLSREEIEESIKKDLNNGFETHKNDLIEEYNKKIKQLEEKINKKKQKNIELKAEKEEVDKELNKLKEKEDSSIKLIDDLQQDKEGLKKELTRNKNEISNLNLKNETLKKEMENEIKLAKEQCDQVCDEKCQQIVMRDRQIDNKKKSEKEKADQDLADRLNKRNLEKEEQKEKDRKQQEEVAKKERRQEIARKLQAAAKLEQKKEAAKNLEEQKNQRENDRIQEEATNLQIERDALKLKEEATKLQIEQEKSNTESKLLERLEAMNKLLEQAAEKD
jgi:hypothetical protein